MRTSPRVGWLIFTVTVTVGACATDPMVKCGTGTHSDGSGTCQIDSALTLMNRVGTNYWSCGGRDASGGSFPVELSLGGDGTTSGSGTLCSQCNTAHYPVTWQEGPNTDGITFSTNPIWDQLTNIVPSSPTATQSFTADAFMGGVNLYSTLYCGLTLGAI